MMIGWAIIGVPLATLFLLGAFFLRKDPILPQQVMGCYTALGAPTLRVGLHSISVSDDRQRNFAYVAEPYKAGYRLKVSPALGLHPIDENKYVFLPDRGIGYFWELLPKGHALQMRAPGDYSGRFKIVAADGTSVIYSRVGVATKCGS